MTSGESRGVSGECAARVIHSAVAEFAGIPIPRASHQNSCEVRYGLAREYLGQTNLPMEEICTLLGYSESANFSHAFRRWSGTTPSEWRMNAAG